MSKGHRPTVHGEHAAFLGRRGGLRPARAHGVQQPGLGPRRHHGEQVQQRTGGLRQPRHPGQHGLTHRGGQPLLLGGEQLGDEERVAAGRGEDAQARARLAGQLRDGTCRQRAERDPQRDRRPQPAEHALQERDHRHLVVAIGEHQQRAESLDAAGDEGQRVEAGVVGPVHILDDQHRRRAAVDQLGGTVGELVEQRGEDGLRRPLGQGAGQRGSSRAAQVVHRTERARGQQVVAGAFQDADTRVESGQERPHDRCLAHAGSAADQRDPTAAGDRRGQCGAQVSEGRLPLQQPHPRTVRRGRSGSKPAIGSRPGRPAGPRPGRSRQVVRPGRSAPRRTWPPWPAPRGCPRVPR